MRLFTPTDEQRAAVEHGLADACVTAGAGSGKTAVLTARYLHLLTTHDLPVRRVAALTFTEKAAAQMRDRIATALEQAGRFVDREEIEFAPISTIHAFCARLLRVHAVEAGLDPAFTVLDEAEAKLLQDDAWHLAVLRLARAKDPDLAVLSRIAADSKELMGFLERVRGSGRSSETLSWRIGDARVESVVVEVEESIGDLLTQASAVDPEIHARAMAAAAEVREALGDLPDRAWRLASTGPVVKDVKPDRGRGPVPLQRARRVLLDVLDRAREAALDDLGRAEVAPPLLRVLGRVEATYAQLKADRGVLDFTDLEVEALSLLERLSAGGRPPAHTPTALLVDEYQDVNPLQARLLACLRRGASAQFSVGDPKQSIYRFRRADVRVIGAEAERVGAPGRHALTATFRARPQLVDCLNVLNERLFADDAAGVEYVPLRAAGSFREVGGPDVEFVVIDGGAKSPVAVRRQAEADWIARWIQELVAKKVPRARVEEDEAGRELPARPLGYGDVAILLRVRTDLTLYEDALAAHDIPFHTHKGRGYFQTDEVVDLIHALRVIHDPADDHALAALLTGPAVGATDADLLRYFPDPTTDRIEIGAAWASVVADGEGRIGDVVKVILRLRREALAGKLGRVVEGALRELGLLEAALLQSDGSRRGANLRKAIDIARRLERDGREDLLDLLRTLETLRDQEIAEAEAPLGRDGEDVVRLNTVHGAKGLEHPVVVLADVGRQPNASPPNVGYDGEGGFAASLRHPLEGDVARSQGWRSIKEEDDTRELEESRRLLYVAMTRAEERLLLMGTAAGHKKKDGTLAMFGGWGPWLVDAFGASPVPDALELPLGAGAARIQLVDPPPIHAPRPRPSEAVAPSEEARAKAAAHLALAAEPVAPLGETPYAVTVTDLLQFARSPGDHHARRLEPRSGSAPLLRAVPEPDDPAAIEGAEEEGEARRIERARLWDEDAVGGTLDRAALGSALHALLARLGPGEREPRPLDLECVIVEEYGGEAPSGVEALLRDMVLRFASSRTGESLDRALREEADVRREIAFHARIRFPAGAAVGPFESLLVRGSIDLWLPESDGLWIIDYKTNPPGAALPTPEAVADHYAWQLRLYALAAERMLGEDVAGARLVLLDPGWGEDVVEVEVDVSGPALEETRRLCEARAIAAVEERWPANWVDLL